MIIHRYQTVSSTNDILKEMAEDGAREWTAVLAENQTAGRGRRGRKWYSPTGNLYLSVLMKPVVELVDLPRMSLLLSLAVHHAIRAESVSLALKWPNDILWEGRKLAGILIEGKTVDERVIHVVAGIGVNMNLETSALPEDLRHRVTSLKEAGIGWSKEEVLQRLERYIPEYSFSFRGPEWEMARAEWCRHASWNRDYLFTEGRRRLVGRPVDLTDEGHLVLQTGSGKVTIKAGELEEV